VIESVGLVGSTAVMPPERLTYRGIALDLERRIIAGEYPPGSRLPSYRELADLYSVSPTTAQAAIRELRAMRYTETVLGRGVFVANPLPVKAPPTG
jgi:GntR family transcriptional regulator